MRAFIIVVDDIDNSFAAPLKAVFDTPDGNVVLDETIQYVDFVPLSNFTDHALWLETEVEKNYRGK